MFVRSVCSNKVDNQLLSDQDSASQQHRSPAPVTSTSHQHQSPAPRRDEAVTDISMCNCLMSDWNFWRRNDFLRYSSCGLFL
ncbi:hypothetical protein BaRGS_00031411 [Batillaria attramentaria]|uniref:Uncharacterized protein n=1 Tax=Batillaria attramentaria TaxID=370345 RepID=A0ABD0JRH1_9CAEN